MTLLWAEGFESFANAAAGTQNGLEEFYPRSTGVSAVVARTGRTGGLAIELTSASTVIMTDLVFNGSGQEHTIGFAYKRTAGTGTATILAIHFPRNTVTSLWEIRSASNGDVVLLCPSSAITITGTGGLPNDGAWHYIHFHIKIHATTGFARVYVDGALKAQSSGNTEGASPEGGTGSAFKRMAFTSAASTTILIDDVYVFAGQLIDDYVVETLMPKGAGATTAFTPSAGSNYACVNEKPMDDDTTYVQSSGSGQIDTYDCDDIGTTDIVGVMVGVLAKSTSGSANVRPVIRSGGTDYPAAVNFSVPSSGYVPSAEESCPYMVASVDPATSLAWDTTAVNAAEFGVKAI